MENLNNKKILLCIDGSDQAYDAVKYVGGVMGGQDVEIILFHVVQNIREAFLDLGFKFNSGAEKSMASIETYKNKIKLNAAVAVEKAREILIDAGIPRESVTIKIQDRQVGIARDIVNEAIKGYSAVVVGRTGVNKIKDIILGSISIKLIEKLSSIPVWVVGGNPDTKKILIGLDASEGAMQTVDYVGKMLNKSNVEIALINVVRGLDIFQQGDMVFEINGYSDLMEEAERRMTPVFNNAKDRLVNAGVDLNRIKTSLSNEDSRITGFDVRSRAGTIVEVARYDAFGTIAVGRRGISKAEEFLIGRVSNKILNMAKEMAVWVVG